MTLKSPDAPAYLHEVDSSQREGLRWKLGTDLDVGGRDGGSHGQPSTARATSVAKTDTTGVPVSVGDVAADRQDVVAGHRARGRHRRGRVQDVTSHDRSVNWNFWSPWTTREKSRPRSGSSITDDLRTTGHDDRERRRRHEVGVPERPRGLDVAVGGVVVADGSGELADLLASDLVDLRSGTACRRARR